MTYTELRQSAHNDLRDVPEYLNADDKAKETMLYMWMRGQIKGNKDGEAKGFADGWERASFTIFMGMSNTTESVTDKTASHE